MDVAKTSLSAGEVISALLAADEELSGKITKIIPVYTEKAILPYISYRRVSLEVIPTKSSDPHSDDVKIDVSCYAKTYIESVEIAERVRVILDNIEEAETNGQHIGSCYLIGAEEYWEGDAYVQQLTFSIKC